MTSPFTWHFPVTQYVHPSSRYSLFLFCLYIRILLLFISAYFSSTFLFLYISISFLSLFSSLAAIISLIFFYFFSMLIYLLKGKHFTAFESLIYLLADITASDPYCQVYVAIIKWKLYFVAFQTWTPLLYFYFCGCVCSLRGCMRYGKITVSSESCSHTRHENYIRRISKTKNSESEENGFTETQLSSLLLRIDSWSCFTLLLSVFFLGSGAWRHKLLGVSLSMAFISTLVCIRYPSTKIRTLNRTKKKLFYMLLGRS